MKNSEFVKNQIDNSPVITEDYVNNPNTSRFYTSNRPINIGDKLMLAFIHSIKSDIETVLQIIMYHPDEYNVIYEDTIIPVSGLGFPTLKLKISEEDFESLRIKNAYEYYCYSYNTLIDEIVSKSLISNEIVESMKEKVPLDINEFIEMGKTDDEFADKFNLSFLNK
jgi:hypothetical protein